MPLARHRPQTPLRALALIWLVAIVAMGLVAGARPAAAQAGVDPSVDCAVPEIYPPVDYCVPSDGGPVDGGDGVVCSSPDGDVDCTVPPGGGITCADPTGCSVPGSPGGGDPGCIEPDGSGDGCGWVVAEEPPIVEDPGTGGDDPQPCPPERTHEGGGCEIPIGIPPSGDDPGGSVPPCPDGGKTCIVPDPEPIDGGTVGDPGSTGDEPIASDDPGTDPDSGAPTDQLPVPVDACAAACDVVSGPPPEHGPATDDAATAAVDPGENGPWVSLRRLDPTADGNDALARATGGDSNATDGRVLFLSALMSWLRVMFLR